MKYPVLFAILTAIFWGTYGPVLGESRSLLKSPFKPYLMIGIAYLVWGIGGGIVGMLFKGDDFSFTGTNERAGVLWGLAAGSLGAFGALTLTLAMFSSKPPLPHIVMPIVFGGAVTVTALVTVWKGGGHGQVNPLMWVGIVGIVICAAMVAYFTPHTAPASPPAKAAVPAAAPEPIAPGRV